MSSRLLNLTTSIELTRKRKYLYTASISDVELPSWIIPVKQLDDKQMGLRVCSATQSATPMRLSDWLAEIADSWATDSIGDYTDKQYNDCLLDIEQRYCKLLIHLALTVGKQPPHNRQGQSRIARRRAAAVARKAHAS